MPKLTVFGLMPLFFGHFFNGNVKNLRSGKRMDILIGLKSAELRWDLHSNGLEDVIQFENSLLPSNSSRLIGGEKLPESYGPILSARGYFVNWDLGRLSRPVAATD